MLEKGQLFPGTGPLPTFWLFVVSLGAVIALVGVYLAADVLHELKMSLKIYWKLNLLSSWI